MRKLETWKDISGYEGLYRISSYGKIVSIARKGTSGKRIRHPFLVAAICRCIFQNTAKLKHTSSIGLLRFIFSQTQVATRKSTTKTKIRRITMWTTWSGVQNSITSVMGLVRREWHKATTIKKWQESLRCITITRLLEKNRQNLFCKRLSTETS